MQMVKDERGITLVELLAVIAILSVILMLIGSAHIFGQRQYVEQSETIDYQEDVRLIMTQLTTDARKVSVTEGATAINQNGTFTLTIGTNVYTHEGTTVKRNGVILSEHIRVFDWESTTNEDKHIIKITSSVDAKNNQANLETVLYFRR